MKRRKKNTPLFFAGRRLAMMLALLSASFQLYGADWQDRSKTVTIQREAITVEEALEQVRNQSGVSLMYQESAVTSGKHLRLTLKGATLQEALDVICAQGGLSYELEGDYVLIKRKKETVAGTQQKKTIVRGIITDTEGEPLSGATIRVLGENTGGIADANGHYEIAIHSGAVLEFSFIGYQTQQVRIGKQEVVNVRLVEAMQALSDVVVTGYQTISKERATGSFDIVGQKNIDKPSVSAAQRLVGIVPGVAASQDSEGNVNLVIRGQGTLASNARPLLVVDGFPIEGGFESVNPNDVESISVLKDAAAASIWGARASNGVIVVTTKSSKKDKRKGLNVEFSAQLKLGNRPDVAYMRNTASSEEMVEYEKSIFGKYGIRSLPAEVSSATFNSTYFYTYTQAGILYNRYATGQITEAEMNGGLERLKKQNNLSQIEELLMQRPVYQQYNLSLSGATERMSNYVSLLYSHNDRRYKRTNDDNFQFNYRGTSNLLSWLDLNLSGMIAYQHAELSGMGPDANLAPYDMLVDEAGNYTNLNHLKFYTPMIDAMVPKDNFPYADWSYNPVVEMQNRNLTAQKMNMRFQSGLTFKIIEGLTFDTKFQYERIQYDYRNLYNEQTFYVRNKVNTSSAWNRSTDQVTPALPSGSILEQSRHVIDAYNFRNQVNFARVLKNVHAVNFVGGLEISQNQAKETDYAPTYGYDDEQLTVGIFPKGTFQLKNWLGRDLEIDYLNKYAHRTARYFSAFANLSYTFDERYSVSASFRTDASNFITDDPQYRYSPFWSVGMSWNLKQEAFMNSLTFIDHLKLRFTYGSNGNANSTTSVVPLIKMLGYNQKSGELEAQIWSKGNPNLRWERTNVFNLGADFDLWRSKFYGKVDLYYKYGKDILGDVAIPMINGGTSAIFNNAEIRNRGVEFMIGSRMPISEELQWEGSLSFAYNENRIMKLFKASAPYWMLSGETSGNFQVEGKPLNAVYSYVYGGVQNVGTADNPRMMPVVNLKAGEVMPFGGQTTYDGLEFLAYQGTRVAPYNLGMNHTFSYRNLSLSFIFVGKFGHVFRRTGFNYAGRGETPNGQLPEVMNGKAAEIVPMPLQDTDELSQWSRAGYLDYLTTNAGNVRLQELLLSYSLPKKLLSKWNMNRLTIYCQGNNLFTIKHGAEDPDYPYGSFRLQPSYTLGVKFGF